MATTDPRHFPILCPDLTKRHFSVPEKMEDPHIPDDLFKRTLDQFTTVNRLFSRYRTVLKSWVIGDMKGKPEREYTLLDIGAGACDIDRWLADYATRHGLRVRILAVDADPRVAAYCRMVSGGFPQIKVREQDASEVLEKEQADFVFANHLLHHLSDEEVISLLQTLDDMPLRRYVLSDIARSCLAWIGFRMIARPLAPRSYIVGDGLSSILRAFTVEEMRQLVARASLRQPVRVIPVFPSRFVVVGGGSKSVIHE